MVTKEDLITPNKISWCPGCGNFGIWQAFNDAAVKQNWNNTNSVLVAGIGCHGHIVNFIKITAFEGLHGRALPVAAGIKMANHNLNVFVYTGDGDSLAEGGNHFIHAARKNHNLTVLLHDNAVYGLTVGQTSPTAPKGYHSKSSPSGNIDEPLHPLRLALAAGATFLAREYAGNTAALSQLIVKANAHNGFSVIQILQPCHTFNKTYTHQYYRANIYELGPEHDTTSQEAAFAKTLEWGDKKIPVGVFYEVNHPTNEDQLSILKEKVLIDHSIKRNIQPLMNQFL